VAVREAAGLPEEPGEVVGEQVEVSLGTVTTPEVAAGGDV
jgi:hypothetical protein